MTRNKTIKVALRNGWRRWGKTCFRRGMEYAWIDDRYITRSGVPGVKVSYLSGGQKAVAFLMHPSWKYFRPKCKEQHKDIRLSVG